MLTRNDAVMGLSLPELVWTSESSCVLVFELPGTSALCKHESRSLLAGSDHVISQGATTETHTHIHRGGINTHVYTKLHTHIHKYTRARHAHVHTLKHTQYI